MPPPPPSTFQSQTAPGDRFWAAASLNSTTTLQDASMEWPLSVIPLAHHQRFYQEVNQEQRTRKRHQQQQIQREMDKRKVYPMAPRETSSSFDGFNGFGQHRRSARSLSDHDLTKLGIETSTKSANGQQKYLTISPDGGGLSSGDSFVSAYSGPKSGGGSQRGPPTIATAAAAHSPNNSGSSSQSTAPIFIANNSNSHFPQSPFQQQFNTSRNTPLPSPNNFPSYSITQLHKLHRGELSINEKYRYDLSRAQLKASSRTSALLSGFAMIALVELQYMPDTPKHLLIMLGVVTTLLVSVHLLALMMSTCLLPYIEANGCTQDSPHIKLKFYIELSWIFSTCIGLVLFLLEIGVIFFVKFNAIGYNFAAYITTGMLIPVLIIFVVISYLIHRNRLHHSLERVNDKVVDLQKYLAEAEVNNQSSSIHRNMVGVGLQGVTVVRNSGGNFKE